MIDQNVVSSKMETKWTGLSRPKSKRVEVEKFQYVPQSVVPIGEQIGLKQQRGQVAATV